MQLYMASNGVLATKYHAVQVTTINGLCPNSLNKCETDIEGSLSFRLSVHSSGTCTAHSPEGGSNYQYGRQWGLIVSSSHSLQQPAAYIHAICTRLRPSISCVLHPYPMFIYRDWRVNCLQAVSFSPAFGLTITYLGVLANTPSKYWAERFFWSIQYPVVIHCARVGATPFSRTLGRKVDSSIDR
jgi:hypothetical protein